MEERETIENVDRVLNPWRLLLWRGTPHAHADQQQPSRTGQVARCLRMMRDTVGGSKSFTKGSAMALYELRTYTLRVGAMAEAVKLYQEIGFPALQKGSHDKKLVGYFQADTGTINQILHLWKFDDDADRRAHWAAVYANKDFVEGFASNFAHC